MRKDILIKDIACLSAIGFISVSITLGGVVAGYFWMPSWYGWVSLLIGIALTCLVALFAYHVCLLMVKPDRVYGKFSLFLWGLLFAVMLRQEMRQEEKSTTISPGNQ